MSKVRRLQVLFVLGLLLLSFQIGVSTASAQGGCFKEEYFTTWCEYICTHSGTWGCWEEDEERCCFEHVDGDACSEAVIEVSACPECVPGGCGF